MPKKMKTFTIFLLVAFLSEEVLSVRVTLQNGDYRDSILTGRVGETARLSCSATATRTSGTPFLEWTYTEFSNDQPTHLVLNGAVVDSVVGKIEIDQPYSIFVKDLVSADSGKYTCRVTIPGDVPSVDYGIYNFTVLVPPGDVSCGFPGDLQITLEKQAEFRCGEINPVGVPPPTFTWYKNDVPLPTKSGSPPYTNASFSYSQQTGKLMFSSVKPGDAGTYYCKASNQVGESQCSAAVIKTKQEDVGMIVGIVFGVIFALLLIGVLIWWTWRKGYFDGLCDGYIGGKEEDGDAPDDDGNDIVLDGAGPLVTKEPSEWSNGTSNKQDPSMMI